MSRHNTVCEKHPFTGLLICVMLAAYLGGCAVAAVGAVAVVSVDIARDRRTLGTYVDDNSVEMKIRSSLKQDSQISDDAHLSVTSMNGIVLLTGEVPDHQQGRRAVAIARGYSEARQVINQLNVAPKTSVSSHVSDSWITTKVKSVLAVNSGVSADRVKVVTERGTVYMMGVVTREEADAAVEATRRLRGVTRIVKVFEYI
ncbi:MAG: hypothetical protein DHS20C01_20270 [marine bacterium B5-7]|nr:MAG: hypothetical protein DHS20C01_20270 [marine bacterium B5-7]